MHEWGDETFDWGGLDEAIRFIAKWLRILGVRVYCFKEKYGTARISCFIGSSWLLFRYRCWVYRTVYWLACRKWPHLKTEICCDADYDELLRGLWDETTM